MVLGKLGRMYELWSLGGQWLSAIHCSSPTLRVVCTCTTVDKMAWKLGMGGLKGAAVYLATLVLAFLHVFSCAFHVLCAGSCAGGQS